MLNTSQAYNFKLWGRNDYAEHAYARSTQGISTYSGQIDYLTGIVSARMVYMQNKLAGW